MKISQLATPALLVDASALDHNLAEMAAALPLVAAHQDVGGDVVSAGGTGTYACNTWASEIQAGSYALMDVAYGRLELPFRQAVFLLATVGSSSGGRAVADAGPKAPRLGRRRPESD